MISSNKAEDAFTKIGYTNWKKALEKNKGFAKHQASDCHKEATERLITAHTTAKGDIAYLIDENSQAIKQNNREMLLKILSSIRYLARQSLPLRGNWKEEEKSEYDSNFFQLLKLRCEDNPKLAEWMDKKSNKFLSPKIQNEMLQIMALQILRDIAKNIQSDEIYSILVDETADTSNKEQMVLCMRWVDENLIPHEEFISLHAIPDTSADEIVVIIKDILLRMNLRIENARGQFYDGVSSMSGKRSGVATQIKPLNRKCLYTHCYGHALNLAVGDVFKTIANLESTFATAHDISKLVKKSPKRNMKLDSIREASNNKTKGISNLWPTRWTVRGEAMHSYLNNYSELMELWEWSLKNVTGTEMKARIRGIQVVMGTFDFVFGCSLGGSILRQTGNFSKTLQHEYFSAAQGQELATTVIKTLTKDRSDQSFDLFWEAVKKRAVQLGTAKPKLPRKRKLPDFYGAKTGNATPHFHDSPKDRYRAIYFETYDSVINFIKQIFDQPDYRTYIYLQETLIKAAVSEDYQEDLCKVCEFYNEINQFDAKTHLAVFSEMMKSADIERTETTLGDIIKYLQKLPRTYKLLISEVIKIAKIVLVMPATNALSERSFSALKRVKTSLRSTATDSRLNNILTFHVHKEELDSLNISKVADEFISLGERNLIFTGTHTEQS